jgi:hypothetical protein
MAQDGAVTDRHWVGHEQGMNASPKLTGHLARGSFMGP